MTLEGFFLLLLGSYLLTSAVVAPYLVQRLRVAAPHFAPGIAGMLLAMRSIGLCLLVALLVAGLLVGWVWVGLAAGSSDAAGLLDLLQRLDAIGDWLERTSEANLLLLCGLAAAGLIYWLYHAKAGQVRKVQHWLLTERWGALVEARRQGTLPELPPTPAMAAMAAEYHALRQSLEAPPAAAAANENEPAEGLLRQRADAEARCDALAQAYVNEDLGRRLELELPQSDITGAPPPARRWWGRLAQGLLSVGMLRGLSGLQRAILVAQVAVGVPALLDLGSAAAASAVQARAAQLDELRVRLLAEDGRQRLAQVEAARAREQASEPAAEAAAVARAAATVAMAFEAGAGRAALRQLLRSDHAAPMRPLPWHVHAHISRTQVLETVAQPHHPGVTIGTVEPPPSAHVLRVEFGQAGNDPLGRQMVSMMQAGGEPAPRTALGQALAARLEGAARERPGFGSWLVAHVDRQAADFRVLARPGSLRAALATSLLGGTLDAVPAAHAAEAFGTAMERAALDAARPRLHAALQNGYLEALIETRDPRLAEARLAANDDLALTRMDASTIRSTVDQRLPSEDALAARLRPLSPHLVEAADGIVPPHALTAQLARYHGPAWAAANEAARARAAATATASFADQVPLELLAHGAQFAGSVPSRAGAAGGGNFGMFGGGSGHYGGSYARTGGRRRIKGIVIGREPSVGPTGGVAIREFDWSIDGPQVTLRFVRGDGTTTTLGPFSAAILHGALAYAADGRPLAMTITESEPFQIQRVLPHPSLTDTSLGCHLAHWDMAVDDLSYTHPGVAEARRVGPGLALLYAVARGEVVERALADGQVPANIARLIREADAQHAPQIAAFHRLARGEGPEPGIGPYVAAALSRADHARNPRISPLTGSQGHFHPAIISLVSACSAEKQTPGGFLACIREAAASQSSWPIDTSMQIDSGHPGTRSNWSAPTPSLVMRSGTRENAFVVDDALAFAAPSEAAATTYAVLQAFTDDPPYAGFIGPWYYRESWAPRHYRLWETDLAGLGLAIDVPALRRTRQVVDQFTAAQRLFRAAFAGQLGPEFPLDALPALARETAPLAERQRTLRWRPGSSPAGSHLAALLSQPEIEPAARATCLAAIGSNLGELTQALRGAPTALASRLDDIAPERFANACGLSDAAPSVADFARRLAAMHAAWSDGGARADSAMVAAGRATCAPMRGLAH